MLGPHSPREERPVNQNCVALQGESPPPHAVKGREGGVLREECGTPSRHVGVGVARGRLLNELQSMETGGERQGGSRSDVKDAGVGLMCKGTRFALLCPWCLMLLLQVPASLPAPVSCPRLCQ